MSAAQWWCQYCNAVVEPRHVTYHETHDERAGGCGGPVFGGGEKAARDLEAENAALRLVAEEAVKLCEVGMKFPTWWVSANAADLMRALARCGFYVKGIVYDWSPPKRGRGKSGE